MLSESRQRYTYVNEGGGSRVDRGDFWVLSVEVSSDCLITENFVPYSRPRRSVHLTYTCRCKAVNGNRATLPPSEISALL